MDVIFWALSILCLMGTGVFAYGNISGISQIIFNKTFDSDKHEAKYGMKTIPYYMLMVLGLMNIAQWVFPNETFAIAISVLLTLTGAWYFIQHCIRLHKLHQ